jgi:hypothetical protein
MLTPKSRLFLIFVSKFLDLPFLKTSKQSSGETMNSNSVIALSCDDDLDLGLYYLRTLSNVLRWAPDSFWGILSSKTLSVEAGYSSIPMISKLKFHSCPNKCTG